MLNYIWAALLISAFVFAGVSDIGDLSRDTYRNGQPLPVVLEFPQGTAAIDGRTQVRIRINAGVYQDFYGTDESPAASYDGVLLRTGEGMVLRFDAGAALPEPLETIRGVSRSNDDELQGTVEGFLTPVLGLGDDPTAAEATVQFEPVRFVKMTAIGAAALDFAETAAGIAIGLIGVLALFLGVMKIAEEAGIIYAIVRVVRPVLRPLFPDVPDDHPALGMIALNLTANVFGLGNAATPFGIKAMEELQKLNPSEDTATNPMVMLLAVNTASVQLVPPVLLLALLGLQINRLIFAIIITTGLSLLVAIIAARLYGKLPGSRASDPNRKRPFGEQPREAGRDSRRGEG
ncbi:MAG: nucleoside recognition protein [Gammaproteobacteria bacterium]|nr:nucleoside recognition protein [Gammaproteobacteria bacterium]MYC52163.1 nucleoside recognition protein [Gammaproteobacteria bacterium]